MQEFIDFFIIIPSDIDYSVYYYDVAPNPIYMDYSLKCL